MLQVTRSSITPDRIIAMTPPSGGRMGKPYSIWYTLMIAIFILLRLAVLLQAKVAHSGTDWRQTPQWFKCFKQNDSSIHYCSNMCAEEKFLSVVVLILPTGYDCNQLNRLYCGSNIAHFSSACNVVVLLKWRTDDPGSDLRHGELWSSRDKTPLSAWQLAAFAVS